MTDKQPKKVLIDSWDEVPEFASEADEQTWWKTHDFSDRLLAGAVRSARTQREKGGSPERPADLLARMRQKVD